MKNESIKESAENNFKNGLYCAESVVLSITKAHGIESKLLPRAATAFCSGMSRTCGTCGALTGAVMGISAILGRNDTEDSVEEVYKVTGLLIDKFQNEFGARNCHELLECDLGTPEGQNAFKENKLHERCSSYTSKAAEFAGDILSQMNSKEITSIPDVKEVIPLLEKCGLPTDDINSKEQIEFYGIGALSSLVGIVGLEIMSDVALLRSLAVSPGQRGKSIGEKLVRFAESKASSRGVGRIYMLTTTAQSYFERLGYEPLSRDLAPEEIKKTNQFSSICPSSAVFMIKELCS